MPNVVGMTEADALSTMRSLGLVARVIYEDEKSEQEGICFMQEFDAGDVWNTDASFFIWIQRSEPEKTENMEGLRENESSDLEDIEPVELDENQPEGFPEADEIIETPEVEEDTHNIEITIPTTEPTEENSTDAVD